MKITRNDKFGESYLVEADSGRIAWLLENHEARPSIVPIALRVDGKRVSAGETGYSVQISTSADMSDRFWSGGHAGQFVGDQLEQAYGPEVVIDGRVVDLLPATFMQGESFRVRQQSLTWSKHDGEGAVLAFDRQYSVDTNGNLRVDITRTTLRNLCIWTEYVAGFTGLGKQLEATHYVDWMSTNAARIRADHNGSVTGVPGSWRRENVGELGAGDISDYDWFVDATEIGIGGPKYSVEIVAPMPLVGSLFDKANGQAQIYLCSFDGPADFVRAGDVRHFGYDVNVTAHVAA